MKIKERLKKNIALIVVGLIIVWSFFIRLTDIMVIPIANEQHAFRQSETAIVIQNYFHEGWSLFQYQIPVWGKPWTTCIFECPIYQTVVYVAMKLLHQTDINLWGRIYSIVFFYLSAWVLKKVMDLFVDKNTSLWICVVYVLLPYNIYWSRAILIDYMSVLFGLLYIWGLYGWLKEKKNSQFIFGLLFGSLGYLLKASTMFPIIFFLAFWILYMLFSEIKSQNHKLCILAIKKYVLNNWKRLLFLGIICIIPALIGAIWMKYTDVIRAKSIYTNWLSDLSGWNYGTWKQKLNYDNWRVILERICDFFGGFYIFALLLITYIINCNKKNMLMIISCAGACLLTVFTLFNLFYIHTYYLISLSPFICICFGVMISEIYKMLKVEKRIGNILIGALGVLLMHAQTTTNEDYIHWTLYQENTTNANVGIYINQITERDERILIEGEDWDPTTLYYADRKGFMLRNLSDKGVLREDNYTTLVVHHLEYLASIIESDDNLIQYPRYNNVYIYKLYGQEEYDKIESKCFEYSLKVDNYADNVYNIDGKYIQYIEIVYDSVDAGKEIPISINAEDGWVHTDKIYLPENRDSIYYYIYEKCKNPASISFGETIQLEMAGN
ncbi:ArnT family glycosyltransferase [Parablautia muri]|uniref:Glycosyltransferase RgtA/B/C/D-like domain-containing protein n=1 Tax=Parablautia muri TaxID=2320879 RepID=A0A9X5GQR9_9FIRM|nr:glycosyltransferase family 39 protein [Parablautia muri]NBJ91345.1 hypothetical protein [Parablautia muri]